MNQKPQLKKSVSVDHAWKSTLTIQFRARKEIAEKVAGYGQLEHYPLQKYWWLRVDPRYDFDEIVAYIESLNMDFQEST